MIHDIKEVFAELNVLHIQDQQQQNNLNVFMGLVMKQYLYSHDKLVTVYEEWRHAVVEGEYDFQNNVKLLRHQIRKCFLYANEQYKLGKDNKIPLEQLMERKKLLNYLNKIKNLLVNVHNRTKIFKETDDHAE